MKKYYLSLIVIANIGAAECSDIKIEHPYTTMHTRTPNLSANNNMLQTNMNFIGKITKEYNTTNPDALAQLIEFDKNLSDEKKSKILIAAAVYDHTDIRNFLYQIDKNILSYLESKNSQSKDAIQYYEHTLLPKVISHLKINKPHSENIDEFKEKLALYKKQHNRTDVK